jgi:phosphoribosyl 1,2-cyclic phosphodiesterase
MGIRLCTLSSGSNANCTYVEAGSARILVDAGLSGRAVRERLEAVGGCAPDELDAILVTHEHRDHITGVGVLARRHRVPVYTNEATGVQLEGPAGPRVAFKRFSTGRRFRVAGAGVMPFPISHDAAEPVGFILEHDGVKAVIATDMGELHPLTRARFRNAHLFVLESNHDPQMLTSGPYPEYLKKRIRSPLGHLSNEESACHLGHVLGDNTRGVLLAHLSENNNTPDKALEVAGACLDGRGRDDIQLEAAPRYEPSSWFEGE